MDGGFADLKREAKIAVKESCEGDFVNATDLHAMLTERAKQIPGVNISVVRFVKGEEKEKKKTDTKGITKYFSFKYKEDGIYANRNYDIGDGIKYATVSIS